MVNAIRVSNVFICTSRRVSTNLRWQTFFLTVPRFPLTGMLRFYKEDKRTTGHSKEAKQGPNITQQMITYYNK